MTEELICIDYWKESGQRYFFFYNHNSNQKNRFKKIILRFANNPELDFDQDDVDYLLELFRKEMKKEKNKSRERKRKRWLFF